MILTVRRLALSFVFAACGGYSGSRVGLIQILTTLLVFTVVLNYLYGSRMNSLDLRVVLWI